MISRQPSQDFSMTLRQSPALYAGQDERMTAVDFKKMMRRRLLVRTFDDLDEAKAARIRQILTHETLGGPIKFP